MLRKFTLDVVGVLLLLVAVPASIGFAQAPDEETLPNCPIMTDNQATRDFYVDYKGKRYYFCCDGCIEDFNSDPERFANQKGVQGYPLDASSATVSATDAREGELPFYQEPEGWDWVIDRGFASIDWLSKTHDRLHLSWSVVRWHFVAMLVAVFGFLIWGRRNWRNRRESTRGGEPASLIHRFGFLAVWGVILLVLVESWSLAHRFVDEKIQLSQTLREKEEIESKLESVNDISIEEQTHFGTFITFGFPPRPRPPRDYVAELKGTYYRGNDERHDSMLNGGNYLTVTFEIMLETEDGKEIDYGDEIGSDPVYLRVKFIRANQTSSGYFTSEYMKRMYVTMKWHRFLGRDVPVDDRVDWDETEPGKVWQARYRLPSGDQFHSDWKWFDRGQWDIQNSRGVVYLCEERYDDEKIIGGRYHYGIEYHLMLNDGKVSPQSKLFMGATYLGRNFTKYQITAEEWLSMDPIPEHAESSD